MKSLTPFYPTFGLCHLSVLLICVFACGYLNAQSSLVNDQGGSLSYPPFAATGQTNVVNTIPDFSHAGYKGGGVPLPTAPVRVTLSPSGFDDTPMIQNAIDMVGALPMDANGLRGAVLLTAGRYELEGELYIEASGVVLRGEGQGLNGTVIYAKQQGIHQVITIQGNGNGYDRNNASRQRITTPYVPLGATSFEVENAANYSPGDTIIVTRTPNQFWIDELGMDVATLCADDPNGCNGWTPGSYTINHERVITAVAGNTITINIPIVDIMENQYGGGEVTQVSVPGRITQCGVERLRIESYYDPNNPEDENHAWIGVQLNRTVNSWVKNVTGEHLGYGTVSISAESNFNTIQECANIDPISRIAGGRRYSFNISDGLGNLFQRNYTRGGRHDFVMGSRVAGPNVFLDNFSTNTFSDIGPHHRWSTGTLFDNIGGGQMRVQNRGSSGSGHGWAGNATMFWNLSSFADIKVESPLGGMNWGIGCQGAQQDGAGYWESWNNPVLPRSLYLQQLQDRLGTQAVNNITIPEQRTGTIYAMLEAWAGQCEFAIPATTQRIYVTEDAYVRGGSNENTNYGTSDNLAVKENAGATNTNTNNDRKSFLKFDLRSISGPIFNVKLRLFVTNTPPNAAQNNLHLVTDDSWSEGEIKWTNQPDAATLIAVQQVPLNQEWTEYDITTFANNEIDGDGILSLRLSEATFDNLYAFASKEEGGQGRDPHLVYQLTPQGNTNDGCETILPVTWTYFSATQIDKHAWLEWVVNDEINHDYYTVEWGTDGQTFTVLDRVDQTLSQTGITLAYNYTHPTPSNGTNYYRIRQVNYDGTYSFSPIRRLDFNGASEENSFSISPNPAQERVTLQLPTHLQSEYVQLFSITGKLIKTQLLNAAGSTTTLSLLDVPSGVYLINIGAHTQKFIKR